jgi:hypothetical protein
MALEQEQAFFQQRKEDLLLHYAGQFALIKGETLAGTYTTFNEAFDAGVARFGNVPFLIKPVVRDEDEAQIPALFVGMVSAHP